MKSDPHYELRVARGRHWTRVYAEVDGQDVSHLGYGPHQVQVGSEASVRMAGIGGVGTEHEQRRRGLAGAVFAYALALMREEGFSTVGLYTSRRIVAHRMYRRFGLVDLVRRRRYLKLLDQAQFAREMLKDLARASEELRSRRTTLRLDLPVSKRVYCRLEGNDVSLLSTAPRRVDLALAMTDSALIRLARHEITLEYAQATKLVRWSGDSSVWAMLCRASRAGRQLIHEG